MKELREIICVDIGSLRFLQNYVKRPTIEAKTWIDHLQSKWGDEWRAHRFDLRRSNVGQRVIDQLAFLELILPIDVERRGDIYIVQNGTHTAYSYWQKKAEKIPVRIVDSVGAGNREIYTFEEIRVEKD